MQNKEKDLAESLIPSPQLTLPYCVGLAAICTTFSLLRSLVFRSTCTIFSLLRSLKLDCTSENYK